MDVDSKVLGKQITNMMQEFCDKVGDAHNRYTGRTSISDDDMRAVEKECDDFFAELYEISVLEAMTTYLGLVSKEMYARALEDFCCCLDAIREYRSAVGKVYNRPYNQALPKNLIDHPTFKDHYLRLEFAGVIRRNFCMVE